MYMAEQDWKGISFTPIFGYSEKLVSQIGSVEPARVRNEKLEFVFAAYDFRNGEIAIARDAPFRHEVFVLDFTGRTSNVCLQRRFQRRRNYDVDAKAASAV